MTYVTITTFDEPDEYPCDNCMEETNYRRLTYFGDDNLCPHCFDERMDAGNE